MQGANCKAWRQPLTHGHIGLLYVAGSSSSSHGLIHCMLLEYTSSHLAMSIIYTVIRLVCECKCFHHARTVEEIMLSQQVPSYGASSRLRPPDSAQRCAMCPTGRFWHPCRTNASSCQHKARCTSTVDLQT